MPRRAAVPRVLRLRGRGRRGTTRSASCGAARRSTCRARWRALAGMTQTALQRAGAPRLRQGRRVPAPRPGAPARARRGSTARCPTTARDELHPPPRRFDVELLERAIRDGRRRRSRAGRRRARRRRACAGATSSTSASSTTGERARRDRRLPRQVRDQEHRAGRRAAAPRRPRDEVDARPVREHVRAYLRAAFELDADRDRARASRPPHAAASRRPTSRPTGTRPRSRSACSARWAPTSRCACACTTAPSTPAASRGCSTTRPSARDTTLVGRARRRRARAPGRRRLDRPGARPARAARPRAIRGWRACAHAFGYRGHCLTKSRRYSTTFKALREAREAYVHAADPRPLHRRDPARDRRRAASAHRGASNVDGDRARNSFGSLLRARRARAGARSAVSGAVGAGYGLAPEIDGRRRGGMKARIAGLAHGQR